MDDSKDAKVDPKRLIPVNEAIETISFGVSAMVQTSEGIRKAFAVRFQQRQKTENAKKIQAHRLLNAKKQADKESLLEATPKKSVSKKPELPKGAGSVMSRMLDGIVSIFFAWLIQKLPDILKGIEKAIAVIGAVWRTVSNLMTGIADALRSVVNISQAIVANVTSLDFFDNEGRVKNAIGDMVKSLKKTKKQWDSDVKGIKNAIKDTAKSKSLDESAEKLKDKARKEGDVSPYLTVNVEGTTEGNKINVSSSETNVVDGGTIGSTDDKKDEVISDVPPAEIRPVNDEKEIVQKLEVSGRFDLKTGQAFINDKEVDHEEYNLFINLSDKEKLEQYGIQPVNKLGSVHITEKGVDKTDVVVAKGDGEGRTKKIVTPSGLGIDYHGKRIILNPDAAKGWKEVLKAAAKDGVDLTKDVTSSFRSAAEQQSLIDRAKAGDPNVMTPAPVGSSPHQQGWAVDLSVGSPGWKWMKKNGGKYGWRWNTDPRDPVHFDYMRGAPDNQHWIKPGRNEWMQSKMAQGDRIASINNQSRITVPIPINSITKQVIPIPSSSDSNPMDIQVASNGRDLKYYVKTINRAYT